MVVDYNDNDDHHDHQRRRRLQPTYQNMGISHLLVVRVTYLNYTPSVRADDLRGQLLQAADVEAATPFVELQAMLHQGKHTQPVLIYGLDAPPVDPVRFAARKSAARCCQLGAKSPVNRISAARGAPGRN